MSNLHSRLDSHLFERLHRTTVFLADAVRPCWERADRILLAWGDAMRAAIRRATLLCAAASGRATHAWKFHRAGEHAVAACPHVGAKAA